MRSLLRRLNQLEAAGHPRLRSGRPQPSVLDLATSLRLGFAIVAVAGVLLTGCGDDLCTSASACPVGPSETPSQEDWRLAGDATLTLLNRKLGTHLEVPLDTRSFDFRAGGPDETCDTTTAAACSQVPVVLSMRLPTIEHDDPETGKLTFVTKDPEITVFGTMSLDLVDTDVNVYRAATLEARTCSSLQSSPPDGAFRDQGHQVHWTSQIELRVSRDGQSGTLSFMDMPLTLTSNEASCEPFEFYLSAELSLER